MIRVQKKKTEKEYQTIYLPCKVEELRHENFCESLNFRLPEEPRLITASGHLLEGSKAEALQLDSTLSHSPLLVFGGNVLGCQFLEKISRSLDPSECGTVPQRTAG